MLLDDGNRIMITQGNFKVDLALIAALIVPRIHAIDGNKFLNTPHT